MTKLREEMQVPIVKVHTFGDNRKTILEDSAGGNIFTDEYDTMLLRAASDLLGPAESIITQDDMIM